MGQGVNTLTIPIMFSIAYKGNVDYDRLIVSLQNIVDFVIEDNNATYDYIHDAFEDEILDFEWKIIRHE